VAFLIAMAGPALPYSDDRVTQVERIAAASGASQAEIDEAVALQRTFVERAIAEDWEALEALAVEHVTDQLAALPEAQRAQLGDIDAVVAQQAEATVAAFQSPWLSYFMTYDPRVDLRRITAPTLVLFGELDVQVDLEQNRAPFEAALAEAGNDDVTVVVVPQANHLFQAAATGNVDEYMALEMAFAPGFLDLIGDWLAERFLPPFGWPAATFRRRACVACKSITSISTSSIVQTPAPRSPTRSGRSRSWSGRARCVRSAARTSRSTSSSRPRQPSPRAHPVS
jgi:uncharacterized protein